VLSVRKISVTVGNQILVVQPQLVISMVGPSIQIHNINPVSKLNLRASSFSPLQFVDTDSEVRRGPRTASSGRVGG
jgi:hypothetical protein